jgi:hypothetical protein
MMKTDDRPTDESWDYDEALAELYAFARETLVEANARLLDRCHRELGVLEEFVPVFGQIGRPLAPGEVVYHIDETS